MSYIPSYYLLSKEQIKVWKSTYDFHTQSHKRRFDILKGMQIPKFTMPNEKSLTGLQLLYWRTLQTLIYSQ